ncbi:MAG: methyl-accepting chemotaxis protein [Lachnospiraceae bacterium]|nr:methyl-accepting chemotaxis protein [Lachnospiraceae bacterium]
MDDVQNMEEQTMEQQILPEDNEKEDKAVKKSPKKTRSKNKGMGIKAKLVMLAVVPVIVTMMVIVLFARSSMIDGMQEEAIDGLVLLCEGVKGSYEFMEGDFSLGEDGCIYKGDENISPSEDALDGYTDGSDADLTLCWGKTRMVTSLKNADGSRPVGTDIDDNVWATMQKGEVYRTSDIRIMDKDYYAVYIPLTNADGTLVGAMFAGRPSEDITAYINTKVSHLILIAIFVLLICLVTGYLIASGIAKATVATGRALLEVADGKLNVDVDHCVLRRGDELGQMGNALETLIQKLRTIVGDLKQSSDTLYNSGNSLDEMAGQSSAAADEISRAVEDISKGAVSQAEEIETASQEIATMGEVIESIVHNVGSLTNTSQNMTAAGDASTLTMQQLSESNDRTTAAIARIGEQIRMTNASIEKIGAAATLITSIADQTSLLSLNASIESARAGEAGRGFAVVAGEIQKLAVQSDEAAAEIQQIIDTLLAESEQTMAVMQEAEGLVAEQQQKLNDTKLRFNEVSDGISVSREGTSVIRGNASSCDHARAQVVDVISNLSAISQENAASAEETTASMEELNATINMLAEAASNLKVLSEQLNEEMNFFQM